MSGKNREQSPRRKNNKKVTAERPSFTLSVGLSDENDSGEEDESKKVKLADKAEQPAKQVPIPELSIGSGGADDNDANVSKPLEKSTKMASSKRTMITPTLSFGLLDNEEPKKSSFKSNSKGSSENRRKIPDLAISDNNNDEKPTKQMPTKRLATPTLSARFADDEKSESKGQKVSEIVIGFADDVDNKRDEKLPKYVPGKRTMTQTLSMGLQSDDEDSKNSTSSKSYSKQSSEKGQNISELVIDDRTVDGEISESDSFGNSTDEKITIYVKSLLCGNQQQQQYSLEVQDLYTISELKMALELQFNVDTSQKAIIYQDNQLQDEYTLNACGLKHKSTVFIVPKTCAEPLNYRVNMAALQKCIAVLESEISNAMSKVNEAPGFPPKQNDTYVLAFDSNGQLRLVRMTDIEKKASGSHKGSGKSDEEENEINLKNWNRQEKNEKTKNVMQKLQCRIKEIKKKDQAEKAAVFKAAEVERKQKLDKKSRSKKTIESANRRSTKMIVKKKKKHRISRDKTVGSSSGSASASTSKRSTVKFVSSGPSTDNATSKSVGSSLSDQSEKWTTPEICIAIRQNSLPLSSVIREINMEKLSSSTSNRDEEEADKIQSINDKTGLWSCSAQQTPSDQDGQLKSTSDALHVQSYPVMEDYPNPKAAKSQQERFNGDDDLEAKSLLESSFIRNSNELFDRNKKTVVKRRPIVVPPRELNRNVEKQMSSHYIKFNIDSMKKPPLRNSKEATGENEERDGDEEKSSKPSANPDRKRNKSRNLTKK